MKYKIQANVFAKTLGPACGTKVNTTVDCENEETALHTARCVFNNYCVTLYLKRKEIFNFNDVKIL